MLKISLLTFLTVSFTASLSWADCTSPASPAGGINWDGGTMEVCDGSSWGSFGGSGGVNPTSTCNSYSSPGSDTTGSATVLQWNGSAFTCRTIVLGTTNNDGGGGGGGV